MRTRGGINMTNINLTKQEEQILYFLYQTKYATTSQLARLYFSDSTKKSTQLRRANLCTKKLNERKFLTHLERRIGGVRAGSGSYVWQITTKGLKVLKRHYPALTTKRQNSYEPTRHHLEHTLAISEVFIQLSELRIDKRIQEIDNFQFEPSCWRGWLDSHAGRVVLKPDIYLELSLEDYLDSYFIEVDRSSESLTRIVNKSKQYIRYYNLNIEQANNGVFPLVLWLTPDNKRKSAIEQRLQEELVDYWELFQVITLDDFKDYVSGGINIEKED